MSSEETKRHGAYQRRLAEIRKAREELDREYHRAWKVDGPHGVTVTVGPRSFYCASREGDINDLTADELMAVAKLRRVYDQWKNGEGELPPSTEGTNE